MALGQDQKDFIVSKVIELGSVEKTKRFYSKDCIVDKWALYYSNKLFNKQNRNKAKK